VSTAVPPICGLCRYPIEGPSFTLVGVTYCMKCTVTLVDPEKNAEDLEKILHSGNIYLPAHKAEECTSIVLGFYATRLVGLTVLYPNALDALEKVKKFIDTMRDVRQRQIIDEEERA